MTITTVKNGWKVDVTRKGNRFRQLITESREKAEKVESTAIYCLSNGIPMKSTTGTLETTMLDLYQLTYTLRWSKHKSTSQSRTALNFISLMGCNRSAVRDILNQASLTEFEKLCARNKYSEATIDKYKSAIRAMCDVALSHGYIQSKPDIRFSGKSRRREKFLTKQDESKFLQCMLDKGFVELYNIACFAIDTGCRVSELLSLKKESYHNQTIILTDTKNGESRVIPLTARAESIIKERLSNVAIFGITYEQLKYQWRLVRTSLGYNDEYCFHVCRHTFATRLLMANNPTPMVKLLTGHKSNNSLQVYAHANTEHLRKMINTLN